MIKYYNNFKVFAQLVLVLALFAATLTLSAGPALGGA